ncbi:TonB-dependent receptor [Flavobacteriales bacterium 34_180_T64]|nr:TonB-dependent receptor [Flavobacteriales bacterium 34_180_T64]
MSKKGILFLFISLFFLSTTSGIAQNTSKEQLRLVDILEILENRYQIHFTYLDQTIADKKASLPALDLTLEEALAYLISETALEFIIIDKTSVVISNDYEDPDTVYIQNLDEIVVINYLTTGITKSKSGTITIKPKQFGILPGLIEPDILKTVQALPGILSADESVSNINVRGGTHDQNLILWDGIKMYQSGHFFGLISAFNPYLTTDVIVSKNGTSTKYGDGVSSIIDMKHSNILDNKFKAGAGFNLINADAYAKIPLNTKMEFQASVRRSISDLIITPTYDQYFKRVFQDTELTSNQNNIVINNERFYFYDFATKFLYDISETDKLRVNFLNVFNSLDYDEASTIDAINDASSNTLTQLNLAAGIEYTKLWSSKFTTQALLYFSNYDLNAKNFTAANSQRLIQENDVADAGFKLNAKHNPDQNLNLEFGYQFSNVSISNLEDVNIPVFRRLVKEIIRTHAIYGEAQFTSSNKNTYARIGLRTNYIDKFAAAFTEPRLSISHKLSNEFRLEVLAEFKNQTTSQIIDLQNDFLGIEKRRWVLSNNSSIPIIKSKQLSGGIHYNKNKLLISAEGYIKDVEGITTRSQGFQNQYQLIDAIGKYQVTGIDFLINKQFHKISTWFSYSFSKNNYTFEGLNSGNSFPNNVDIRHTLTFAGTYQADNLKFALGLNWHSGKPTTTLADNQIPNNNTIEYNSPNNSHINDYLRTDFSTTYQFQMSPKTSASIGASIWNIFNRKNVINSYFTEDSDTAIRKVENISLGITPNVSFRLNF